MINEGTYRKIPIEQAFEEMNASEDYEHAAMLRDLLLKLPSGMSGHSLTITTRIGEDNPNHPQDSPSAGDNNEQK